MKLFSPLIFTFGKLASLWTLPTDKLMPPRPGHHPPSASLKMPPPVDQFFNEDSVLEYLRFRGFNVDGETGIIEDGYHWSEHWEFRPLARRVKIRTTLRWPDPRSHTLFEVSEFGGEKVEWGITGAQRLRILVNSEFRKRLLDHLPEIDDPGLLARLLQPKFEALIFNDDGRIHTISHDLRATFWNPEGFSPCAELLRDGYFDFPLLAFEKENTHGS